MTAPRLPVLGSYAAPAFTDGDRVVCAIRQEAPLVGRHEAPTRWPIGKQGGCRFLIPYADLADLPQSRLFARNHHTPGFRRN
jgi:hypothetical protein